MFQSKKKIFGVNNLFKLLVLVAVSAVLVTGLVYKFSSSEKSQITDFVYSRDAKGILKIFDKDWYWLVLSPKEEYSPDFALKNRAYDRNPENFGKLTLKVLREKNNLVGFTAYFKQSFYEGYILYVSVDGDFRGKGYGEKLTRFAVNALFEDGCSIVKLVTRVDNVRSRALYKKLGFQETGFEDHPRGKLVYYTKYKK